MTRKEEVRNASVEYNEKPLVIGGDSILSEEEYLEFNKNSSFIAGAEWADKTMINKVCEWLKENAPKYHWYDPIEDDEGVRWNDMVKDLRKAMEE